MVGFEPMSSMLEAKAAQRLAESKERIAAYEMAEQFGMTPDEFGWARRDVRKAFYKAAVRLAEMTGASDTLAAAGAWEAIYTLMDELRHVGTVERVDTLYALVKCLDTYKPLPFSFLGYVNSLRILDTKTGGFITKARSDQTMPNARSWAELRDYLMVEGTDQSMIDAAHAVWNNYRAWQRR